MIIGTQLHTFAIRGTQTRSGADDTRFTGLATCVANRTMRRCPFTRISHLRGKSWVKSRAVKDGGHRGGHHVLLRLAP